MVGPQVPFWIAHFDLKLTLALKRARLESREELKGKQEQSTGT